MSLPPPPLATSQALEQEETVAVLNRRFSDADARDIIATACNELFVDRVATVSSFGAEAVALLHLVANVARATPVIFLDTGKHFSETTEYAKRLSAELGLWVHVVVSPGRQRLEVEDPNGDLHARDSDRCCYVRKTFPMLQALKPYRAFFTGRKQFQTSARAGMTPFEVFGRWVRINPLWSWSAQQIQAYINDHRLPRHPLVTQGYLSIGCAPCTKPVERGEDARGGRWADSEKSECGIHLDASGKFKRATADPAK